MIGVSTCLRRSDRVRSAAQIGAICFLFNAVVQLENYLFYAAETGGMTGRVGFLVRFPFIQFENAVVAVALGALYLTVVHRRLLKWGYLALLLLCNTLVLLDQSVYKVFQDHMRLSMMEQSLWAPGALTKIFESALDDADGVFFLNLALLAVTGGLFWVLLQRPGRRILPAVPSRWLVVLGLALYGAASAAVLAWTDTHNLHAHPLSGLLLSRRPPAAPAPATAPVLLKQLYTPCYGIFSEAPAMSRRLAAVQHAVQSRPRLPNIVFVVLESVGAKQLLLDGAPNAEVAPFLSELAGHSVIFDSVYGLFPSTTRMHVPLMTGGRTITWGRVDDELIHPYAGPTLVDALNRLNYRTALFSAQDLRFESLDRFYGQLPYDVTVFYGDGSQAFLPEHKVNAWGVHEDAVLDGALAWVDSSLAGDAPFFLHVNTVSTHYPYGMREGHQGPVAGDGRKARYDNALHYTDAVLRRMYEALKARQAVESTLFVITGDHGQAFAELHPGNLAHKNRLYEENIRIFLMIADGRCIEGPVICSRIGAVGDVMPTLLALVKGDAGDAPGQDLLAADYGLRIAFFHKSALPELWGLRDGRWKYIARRSGEDAQLFDLTLDPDEQDNLAVRRPEQVQVYQDVCANWYAAANDDYIARLDGFRLVGGKGLRAEDVQSPGPKVMSSGYWAEDGRFAEMERLHPLQPFLVWTRWVAYPEDRTVEYRVTSPGGQMHKFEFTVQAGWDVTWVNPGCPQTKEPGIWHVSLWDGPARLTGDRFLVDASAELAFPVPWSMGVGYMSEDGTFVWVDELHPDQTFLIWTYWTPCGKDRTIQYRVTAPGGRYYDFNFTVQAGWERTWFNPGLDTGKEEGTWQASLWYNGIALLEGRFTVNEGAAPAGFADR